MDRIAIVTGAGSGVGKAAALALLKGGYRVHGADPKIIQALQAGEEFVAIKVDVEGDDSQIL